MTNFIKVPSQEAGFSLKAVSVIQIQMLLGNSASETFCLYLFDYPNLIKSSITFLGTEMMRWDPMTRNFWNLLLFPLPLSPGKWSINNFFLLSFESCCKGHLVSRLAVPLYHSFFPPRILRWIPEETRDLLYLSSLKLVRNWILRD